MVMKLKERMSHLRLGDSLDKCVDMGAMVDPNHLKSVAKYVEEAQAEGAEVRQSRPFAWCHERASCQMDRPLISLTFCKSKT